MKTTPTSVLYGNLVNKTRDRNGNTRGFIQILVRDEDNDELFNISAQVAKAAGVRYSKKFDAVTTQKGAGWYSTLRDILTSKVPFGALLWVR